MAENTITINDVKYLGHYKLLMAIAGNLPLSDQYDALARALAEELVERQSFGQSEIDALWNSKNPLLRRAMAAQSNFVSAMSDQQAQEIIEDNDPLVLAPLAFHADQLFPNPDFDYAPDRISRTAAKDLLGHMASHEDVEVRRALGRNHCVPVKYRPSFAGNLRERLQLNYIHDMTEDELKELPGLSEKELERLARNLQDIKDKSVLRKVAKFLSACPYPAVRLKLAQDESLPKYVYKMLMADPDLEIASAARKRAEEAE